MPKDANNLKRLLTLVEHGRLDDLSSADVAALEKHLNEDAGAAGSIAEVVPSGGDAGSRVRAAPTAAEWASLWERIESGVGARPDETPARGGAPPRVFTWFRVVTAAAACVAFLLAWLFTPETRPVDRSAGWALEFSGANQILELTVPGSVRAMVHYTDDGVALIAYDDAADDDRFEGALDANQWKTRLDAPIRAMLDRLVV